MNQRQHCFLKAATLSTALLAFSAISPSFSQDYYSRSGAGVRFRAGEGVRLTAGRI